MLHLDTNWWLTTALIGAILAFCGALQAMIGFAAAMFGIPLLMLCGFEMPEAQVIVITAMLPQNVLAVWQLRKELTWREWLVPALVRIAFLPLGVLVMGWMQDEAKPLLRQLVGAVMLTATCMQWVGRKEKKTESTSSWMLGTFSLSGFLQGLCGMSGAPMVLWCYARPWSSHKVRAFLFTVYLTSFVPQWVMLAGRFGKIIPAAGLRTVMALPLILLGAVVGLRLAHYIPDHAARHLSYTVLIVLAAIELLHPLFL
jgi:uncharacterized membrane protein YfcA